MKVNYQSHDHEHEFEAVEGLPEPLPPGERLLWQGSPDWRVLANEALHLRKAAIYFALMLAWRGATLLSEGSSWADTLVSSLPLALLSALALGLLAAIAWLSARTSVYTLTDRRVVMRIGIVLTVTFNLPFSRIDGAALHRLGKRHGDIALTLCEGQNIAYPHLWPHARPWRLKRTEPTLRSLADAPRVAEMLTQALAASAGQAPSVLPAVESPGAASHTPLRGQPALVA
jgi:hypothetical protein